MNQPKDISKNEQEEYYIAGAYCHQALAQDGSVMTPEDAFVWLGESEGYPACGGTPKQWENVADIMEECSDWDGMPWYYPLKLDTLKIYQVSSTRIFNVSYRLIEIAGS